jgi:hypothetical protein
MGTAEPMNAYLTPVLEVWATFNVLVIVGAGLAIAGQELNKARKRRRDANNPFACDPR